MSQTSRFLAAFPALLLAAAGAVGRAPAPPVPAAPASAGTPRAEPAPPQATTADLARAYVELERAFFAAPVERELCREVNTAFDDASKLFFTGDFGRVVEIVRAQTARIMEANALDERVLQTPLEARAIDTQPVPRADTPAHGPGAVTMPDADIWATTGTGPRAVWRERRALLTRAETAGTIESLLFDQRLVRHELLREHDAIAVDRNPYTHRRGDIWRPFFIDDQPAPMRLFCPEQREPPAAGWPLVIALHGAGGNEHMFMAAYGAGRIKRLAEEHGFVVAAPQNSPLAAQPRVFDALVDSIAADYPIDRSRIYLVGHSMGAAVALAWSKSRHETVAACALIAGAGRLSPRDKVPPTLVIAPELDGLVPARSIIENAERAAAAGLGVEVREIKDYGHTLVVGHVLPEVIEWLLKHTRANGADATAPGTPPRTAEQGAAP